MKSLLTSYFIPSSMRAVATRTGARPSPVTQWTPMQVSGSERNSWKTLFMLSHLTGEAEGASRLLFSRWRDKIHSSLVRDRQGNHESSHGTSRVQTLMHRTALMAWWTGLSFKRLEMNFVSSDSWSPCWPDRATCPRCPGRGRSRHWSSARRRSPLQWEEEGSVQNDILSPRLWGPEWEGW